MGMAHVVSPDRISTINHYFGGGCLDDIYMVLFYMLLGRFASLLDAWKTEAVSTQTSDWF